jgi:hypothetical protein
VTDINFFPHLHCTRAEIETKNAQSPAGKENGEHSLGPLTWEKSAISKLSSTERE